MRFDVLAQFFVDGLFISSTYALVALGLSLIFGVMDIADFAQGSLYMLGAYVSFFLVNLIGLPYFLTLTAALILVAAVGVLNNLLIYRPLRSTAGANTLIAALGIMLIVQNLALYFFGSDYRKVASPFGSAKVAFAGVTITYHRIFVVGMTALFISAVWLFLYHTKTGKALRAMSQNRTGAALVGVNIDRIAVVTFALATALAGVAGALMAPVQPFTPTMGSLIILKAFAAVIFGGLGSLSGAVLGAFIIGISETMAIAFISSAYSNLIAFGLMILILFVRPQGLFHGSAR